MIFKRLGQLEKFELLKPEFRGSQAPTPYLMDNRIRVYFSARNSANQSLPFYMDLDKENPLIVLDRAETPILGLGPPGEGDDSGVMVSHVFKYKADNRLRMLYTGWNKGTLKARYRTCCMEAVINDDTGEWVKLGIFLDRTRLHPCGTSMPFINILEEDDYGPLRYEYHFMGYTKWEDSQPNYTIYRDYIDALEVNSYLDPTPIITILPDEAAARSWIYGEFLLFSTRHLEGYRSKNEKAYKIEYAVRTPTGHYTEKNKLLILEDNNPMQAYPSILEVDGKTYMFYNSGKPNDFCSPINIAIQVK